MTPDEELRLLFKWNKALDLAPAYSGSGTSKGMAISRFYGPIPVVLPGNNALIYPTGFLTAVPPGVVADGDARLPSYPSKYPLLAGEWGHFLCTRVSFNSYVSLTYKPFDAAPENLATDPLPAGDLFGSVENNGGAICLNNWANSPQGGAATVTRPHLCAELDIYNLTDGYSLTQGPIGAEIFLGGFSGETHLPEAAVLRRGTEIEPRLYVTDFRLGDFFMQEDNADYIENVQVAAWVNVTFIGHTVD